MEEPCFGRGPGTRPITRDRNVSNASGGRVAKHAQKIDCGRRWGGEHHRRPFKLPWCVAHFLDLGPVQRHAARQPSVFGDPEAEHQAVARTFLYILENAICVFIKYPPAIDIRSVAGCKLSAKIGAESTA